MLKIGIKVLNVKLFRGIFLFIIFFPEKKKNVFEVCSNCFENVNIPKAKAPEEIKKCYITKAGVC